ncbi:MAG: metallophosphoesterase [Pseudomonas sp.]
MKPYGIISDVHAHNWNQFSTTLKDGMNSRLKNILDEVELAGKHVLDDGGDTLYIAGDLFHVRGSVSPMVLNPLIDLFTYLSKRGLKVRILTGNHDLESRDSHAMSSACESLRNIEGVRVISTPTIFFDEEVVMVPWYDNMDDVRKHVQNAIGEIDDIGDDAENYTLILHVPLNGVLSGIPEHGFYAQELKRLGFKRVFCGHYHNFKAFEGEVYSVGATTHQTWSDVGTNAGHIMVDDEGVHHLQTSAPRFIDYDLSWSDNEAADQCSGNFVRVRLGEADDDEIDMIRCHIVGLGALGCQVAAIPVPKGTATKRSAPTVKAPTVRESIAAWTKANSGLSDTTELDKLCSSIMDEVEAVTV